jgi:cysteine desulfurase/selenocysteine lyase
MCGPDGVGVLYGKFEELNKLTPLKIGGGGVSTVALDGASYNLAPLPGRLESGTPNTAGIIGFGAAIDFLNSVGMKNIDTYEKELKKYFDKRIKEVKNIEYVSQTGLYPVCSFNVRDIISQDLANYLGRNKIIARSGLSCAKLSYEITSNKSGYVRVSLYFYNTTKDIDRIISVLKKFKKSDVVDNIF